MHPKRLIALSLIAAITLLGLAVPASASLIKDVRLGVHSDHTRVVVELSGVFTYRLERPSPRTVLVFLRGAGLNPGQGPLPKPDGLVASIQSQPGGSGTTLRINLTKPGKVKSYAWNDSRRLVLEFQALDQEGQGLDRASNKPSSVKRLQPLSAAAEQTEQAEPAKEPAPRTTVEDQAAPEETAPAEKTDTVAEDEPPAVKAEETPVLKAQETAAQTEEQVAPKEPQKPVPAQEKPVRKKEPVVAQKKHDSKDAMSFFLAAPEPVKDMTSDILAKEGAAPRKEEKPGEEETGPEVTRKIAPLPRQEEPVQALAAGPTPDEPPTTLGLTKRIKPTEEMAAGPVLMEEEPPRPKAEPAPKSESVQTTGTEAEQTAPETQKTESAPLAPEADATTRQLFTSALNNFKEGRYEEALRLFEEAEALSPDSVLGEKALFYQADSLFKMYQATGFPAFDRVEGAYQKAIGAFPESPEISRALLRMGIVNYDTGNADKAKGYFNILLKEHPKAKETVEAKVYLARLFLDENKPQQAIRILREVVSAHPDAPQIKSALWYLGRVLFEVGRFQESYQRLTTLNKGWPDFYLTEPMLLYYLGETAFRLDKLEEARDYLYRVTNIAPDISNLDLILTRLGETYRLRNDYKKAAVIYTETQRRFPDSDGALISRIRLAETSGEEQGKAPKLDKVLGVELSPSAAKTYQDIIEKHPDRPVAQLAMLKLGALQYRDKKYLEAFNILKDLLIKHPGTEFYRDAAFALRQSFDQRMKQLAAKKDYLQLLSFYDSFKDNLPQELKVKYAHLLGDAYFDLKLYDKARDLYGQALKDGLKDPAVELNQALALYHLGDDEPAEKAFAAFADKYPAHGKIGTINLYRGRALLRLNRPKEAVQAFEKVLTKGRESETFLPALGLLAETRIKTGEPEAAVELLAKALPRIPDKEEEKSRLSILMGEALLASGRPKEAVAVLAKALQDKPLDEQHAGSYYRLGLAYLEAGRMEKAKEVLNKVVESGGPFWAKMAGNRLAVADLSVRLSARQQEEAK